MSQDAPVAPADRHNIVVDASYLVPRIDVQLAGLSVIAAESAGELSSSRYWLTLAGIVLVGLALTAFAPAPLEAAVTEP